MISLQSCWLSKGWMWMHQGKFSINCYLFRYRAFIAMYCVITSYVFCPCGASYSYPHLPQNLAFLHRYTAFIVYWNGKPRMVVDYRKLNEIAIADKFPLPKQEDILHALVRSWWLSVRIWFPFTYIHSLQNSWNTLEYSEDLSKMILQIFLISTYY